jgi:hypothetical protein
LLVAVEVELALVVLVKEVVLVACLQVWFLLLLELLTQ